MFDAISATLPEQWQVLFQVLTFPIAWIPEFQAQLLDLVWYGGSGTSVFLKRSLLLLPATLIVVAMWTTMLAVYTVPFRAARGEFMSALVLLWWEIGRSIWLFWVGVVRFLVVALGWTWGLIRLTFSMGFRAIRRAFVSPFMMMDWMGRRYFKPGVPWIAFILTLAWSALEALIFTFTLTPTVREVFWDLAGFEPGRLMGPILFMFLFVLISGSFASMQVLAEALENRKVKQFIQMLVVEFFVMFFEVVFLYRELIDAITPWIAAQTGGQVTMGLFSTLALASFGWIGIRAMTWFLFARYGTPALLAVLARETLTMEAAPQTMPQTPEPDWWKAPIEALKQESQWFRARARELLELLSLPVLQLLAAAVNCATVVIAAQPAFNLPFTDLDQVMTPDTLLKALKLKRPVAASAESGQ